MTRSDRIALAAFAASCAFACTAPAPAPKPTPPPTPPPMTAEQSVDFYRKCWGLFNDKSWDAFQNCYTTDATSESVDSGQPPARGRAAIIETAKATIAPNPDVHGELQLVLTSGNHIVSVALWKGTNTAPMPGPGGKEIKATGKPFGFLMAHTVELDTGRTAAQADADYVEVGTLLGQLGISKAPARKVMESGAAEATIVIAKNDAAEAANVASVQAQMEAFNKHDVKALAAVMADNFVLHEIALPADLDKKKNVAALSELFKGFADVQLTASQVFGAGDYVVVAGTFEGTNTGPVPTMGLKKKTGKKAVVRYLEIFRFENGKVAEDWLFYNGAAFAAQLGLA
jgi:hypothetical protein